jgi:hypothetical protein
MSKRTALDSESRTEDKLSDSRRLVHIGTTLWGPPHPTLRIGRPRRPRRPPPPPTQETSGIPRPPSIATEPEIEITDEMIEAGVRALVSYNSDFETEERAVARIYKSMASHNYGNTPPPAPPPQREVSFRKGS